MTIQQEFQAFHRKHTHVYDTLVSYARSLKEAGYTRYSIKGLYEVLRYNQAQQGQKLKLSNNYTSRYARMIMNNNPDLRGFFCLRSLSAV